MQVFTKLHLLTLNIAVKVRRQILFDICAVIICNCNGKKIIKIGPQKSQILKLDHRNQRCKNGAAFWNNNNNNSEFI